MSQLLGLEGWLIKIFVTGFVLVLVPVYWKAYGPSNFLWLSDIGLFMTVFGLWLKSPLLLSMAMVAVFPMELFWTIDFLFRLVTGHDLTGMTGYMFDPEYSAFLRGLSLFHVFIPPIWIWAIREWGYDARAFKYQFLMMIAVFIITYFVSSPDKNINWVYQARNFNWKVPDWLWATGLVVSIQILVCRPMHLLLLKFGGEN